MSEQNYQPPKVWEWKQNSGGAFANINRPVSGATHERVLPVGTHPLQLYSLGTPNGQKVTIMLEELLALGVSGAIFQSLMRRQNDKIDPIRSKFGQIEQEEVSLDEKMMDLRTYAQEHATFRFSELMREQKGKIQMIVTFLALMKTGELTVVQEHLFDDMLITSQL